MTMRYGVIYIAHNPRDGKNIFKVGKTERYANERMKELTASTSTLGTYTAQAFFVVQDIDTAESVCHKRLAQYRVQVNREFFKIPFSHLLQIIQEETASYAAHDFIPKVQSPTNNTITSSSQPTPKKQVEVRRRKRWEETYKQRELWEKALGKELREKALRLASRFRE